MSDDRIVKGFWWHPNTPDERWFGVLEQKAGGSIGLTCHTETNAFDSLAESPVAAIHGRGEKGQPMTLLVVSKTRTTTSNGMTTLHLHPGCVLEGVHVDDKDSFSVLTLALRIQHLSGWLGTTGFNPMVDDNASRTMTISYTHPKCVNHEINDHTGVAFSLQTMRRSAAQKRSITEETIVSFSGKSGLTFTECKEMTNAMRSLLHFAVLKPVYTVGMSFQGLVGHEQPDDHPPLEVTVWSGDFHGPETELPVDGLWVFRYSDVADDFGTFFSNWMGYRAKYAEAMECYTTTIYHSLPTPVKHLCLTQALDAYHGVRFGSHGKRDFKKKLEELCGQHQNALSGLVTDVPSFAGQVRDTRDYLTHHNPDDLAKREVVQGSADLIRLNEKLTILFQSCVLTDNGIPSERLVRLRRRIANDIIEY